MKKEVDINININVQDHRKGTEPNNPHLTISSGEKIKANLSVSQLAFFCRLVHDQEAVTLQNQTDILKLIANNFHTQNAIEISFNSLRSKYYNVDIATKESMKVMINKILKAIDNY